ncbi:hypothetical protein LRP88_12818 [Fusarium phalaenopsidis]
MTDGYIEEPLVNKFANAIPNHGLHGTASVIILFGYRLRSPFECNVSVGMSVFAVAPHCVFLFHDVTTGQVYVFQAKGSFASLLSEQSRFTSFGPTTRWEDLTQITYDDLSAVKVPKPTSLGRDVVALPGGKEFDMSSIYNNTVSQEETLELLSDYAALDVILLAAKTRGKSSSIELWLETARRTHKMTEVTTWEREDIDSQDSPVAQEGPRQSPLGHHWPTADGRRQYTDLLFLPGFKGQRSSKPGIQLALYDTCSICREPNSIQTLLLRASPEEAETEHLPKPGQRAGHKYPLVLGNYPETDVILPITCCDACAFLLLQAGELPNGDRVTIALPLVSLQIQENRNLWEGKLGEVYGHRFHQKIVFLVFLSTLCTTLEDLIDNAGPSDSQSLRGSLEWCCRELSQLSGISARAGLAPVGSPLAGVVNENMPLQEAIQVAFCQSHPLVQENPLLSYPMDGFLVLVRLAGLLQGIEPRYIERFVWRRLLYHFAEQHAELQKQVGAKEAKATLDDLIHEPPAAMGTVVEAESGASPEGPGALTSRIRRHMIPLSSLEGTYLIPSSSDTLEQFGRMEEYFSTIQRTTKHHPVLAVFLHIMATMADGSSLITNVEDFFDSIQDRIVELACKHKDLCHALEPTGSVDEAVAVRLIAAAYEPAKDVLF